MCVHCVMQQIAMAPITLVLILPYVAHAMYHALVMAMHFHGEAITVRPPVGMA